VEQLLPPKAQGESSSWRQDSSSSSVSSSKVAFIGPDIMVGWQELSLWTDWSTRRWFKAARSWAPVALCMIKTTSGISHNKS
jgi:hypothetical protein